MTELFLRYLIGSGGTFMTLVFTGMVLPRRWGLWSYPLVPALCGLSVFPKAAFGYYSAQTMAIDLAMMAVILLVLPAVLFKASYWKCVGVSLYFYAINMLCDAVTLELLRPFTGEIAVSAAGADSVLLYGAVGFTLMTIFYSASVLLFHMLSMRRFHPFYLLFAVFPIGLFLFTFYIFFDLPSYVLLAAFILGVACNIALLIHTLEQEKKAELEEELQAVRRAMELEESHYRAVEEQREALARIRHDFNNQLAAIEGLIQTGETREARTMVDRLAQDIAATQDPQD